MGPFIGSGLSTGLGVGSGFVQLDGLQALSAHSRQELAYQCLTDITLQAAQARADSHAPAFSGFWGPGFFERELSLNKSFKEKLQDEIDDWLRGE